MGLHNDEIPASLSVGSYKQALGESLKFAGLFLFLSKQFN